MRSSSNTEEYGYSSQLLAYQQSASLPYTDFRIIDYNRICMMGNISELIAVEKTDITFKMTNLRTGMYLAKSKISINKVYQQ